MFYGDICCTSSSVLWTCTFSEGRFTVHVVDRLAHLRTGVRCLLCVVTHALPVVGQRCGNGVSKLVKQSAVQHLFWDKKPLTFKTVVPC